MNVFLRYSIIIIFILSAFSIAQAETIGVILTADVPYYQDIHEAMMSRLSKGGYSDRLKFIIQKPYPDPVSWRNAVRKLIATDVDVIVTYGTEPTFIAVRERPGIPIVYAGSYEPITLKAIKKGATGTTIKLPVSSILRYLRLFTPIKNLGVIYSGMESDSAYQTEEIKTLSAKYGFTVKELNLRKAADISAMLSNNDVDALFLTSSALVDTIFPTIMNIARNKKLPTGAMFPHGDSSAIITLMADPREQGQDIAEKLIEVINGKKPENIPTSYSKNIELIFNLKEARDMGLRLPMELMTEATKIIYGDTK